jgi:hypothetical protein
MHSSKQAIFMGMLIVKMPMSSLFEFASNSLFTNTKCLSPSKPIPLECKGELKTTLQTTFANLSKFGEQEVTHQKKLISIGHVPTLLLDKNK